MNNDFWADAEIISSYSRAQALADGVLIDASVGDLATVSAQHYRYPIAMTAAVHNLVDEAVTNPAWGNDWSGVWHDILYVSTRMYSEIDEQTRQFSVIITGAGGCDYHTLKMVCGPDDDGLPCLTVMLASED